MGIHRDTAVKCLARPHGFTHRSGRWLTLTWAMQVTKPCVSPSSSWSSWHSVTYTVAQSKSQGQARFMGMTVAIFAIGHSYLILRRSHSCLGLRLQELKWPGVTSDPCDVKALVFPRRILSTAVARLAGKASPLCSLAVSVFQVSLWGRRSGGQEPAKCPYVYELRS